MHKAKHMNKLNKSMHNACSHTDDTKYNCLLGLEVFKYSNLKPVDFNSFNCNLVILQHPLRNLEKFI